MTMEHYPSCENGITAEIRYVEGLPGRDGPMGPVGPMGPIGLKGETGDTWQPIVSNGWLYWIKDDNSHNPPEPSYIKGDKGAPFRFEDFTPEQLLSLKGPKGDPGTGIADEDWRDFRDNGGLINGDVTVLGTLFPERIIMQEPEDGSYPSFKCSSMQVDIINMMNEQFYLGNLEFKPNEINPIGDISIGSVATPFKNSYFSEKIYLGDSFTIEKYTALDNVLRSRNGKFITQRIEDSNGNPLSSVVLDSTGYRPSSVSKDILELGSSNYKWKDVWVGESSKIQNGGFTRHNNGVTEVWGFTDIALPISTSSYTDLVYPISFSNTPFNPKITISAKDASNNSAEIGLNLYNIYNNKMTVRLSNKSGLTLTSCRVYWSICGVV